MAGNQMFTANNDRGREISAPVGIWAAMHRLLLAGLGLGKTMRACEAVGVVVVVEILLRPRDDSTSERMKGIRWRLQ